MILQELSLRPYNGKLYIAYSRADYEEAHRRLFGRPDALQPGHAGRFSGEDLAGGWTYLVYARNPEGLAHEMAHVILHVFQRCGLDPRDSMGEAFCYMLSQLLLDARKGKSKHNKNMKGNSRGK